MPALVIVLALIGLAGIIAGLVALRRNWQRAKGGTAVVPHQRRLWVVLALGLALAVGSWLLTFFMGYPVSVEPKPGRVVGIPFFVAYFDSEDRDYVGPLTLPRAIANSLFWFLVPQLVLRFFHRREGK